MTDNQNDDEDMTYYQKTNFSDLERLQRPFKTLFRVSYNLFKHDD